MGYSRNKPRFTGHESMVFTKPWLLLAGDFNAHIKNSSAYIGNFFQLIPIPVQRIILSGVKLLPTVPTGTGGTKYKSKKVIPIRNLFDCHSFEEFWCEIYLSRCPSWANQQTSLTRHILSSSLWLLRGKGRGCSLFMLALQFCVGPRMPVP